MKLNFSYCNNRHNSTMAHTPSGNESPVPQHCCMIKKVPKEDRIKAAEDAMRIFPGNVPYSDATTSFVRKLLPDSPELPPKERLIAMVTKYWGPSGVNLSVGFIGDTPNVLKDKILDHMNAWSKHSNVKFTLADPGTTAQVRIARVANDGYWSYLGTDILSVRAADKPTMNLAGFTMNTSEELFRRVLRHETGHTLGFPHEHLRRVITDRIDRQKAIDYFYEHHDWPPERTIHNVLTPLEDTPFGDYIGSSKADEQSIMCYWLPGAIMKDGKAIMGGTDINPNDHKTIAKFYPK